MTHHRLEANIAVELDVEAAFEWYEAEETSLGIVFLEELRSTYHEFSRTLWPFQEIRSGIRRALTASFRTRFTLSSRVRLFSLSQCCIRQRILKNGKSELSFTLTSKLFHLIHVELAEAGCRDWSRSLSAFGPRCSDSSKRAALESHGSY